MKTISKTMAVMALAASVTLGGCTTMGGKQTGGAVLGGIGGAVAGSQFGGGTGKIAATALGTLIGAFIGSEVGASLDRADRQYAAHAEQQAYYAPMGQTVRWNNPQSGHYGTYTPVRDGYDTGSGAYCREYHTTVYVGGQAQQGYGTACQQPDGSWKIVR